MVGGPSVSTEEERVALRSRIKQYAGIGRECKRMDRVGMVTEKAVPMGAGAAAHAYGAAMFLHICWTPEAEARCQWCFWWRTEARRCGAHRRVDDFSFGKGAMSYPLISRSGRLRLDLNQDFVN
jgi:hypothetical protein